jgi:hypothetical protein
MRFDDGSQVVESDSGFLIDPSQAVIAGPINGYTKHAYSTLYAVVFLSYPSWIPVAFRNKGFLVEGRRSLRLFVPHPPRYLHLSTH